MRVVRVVFHLGPMEAEDVVQEAFVLAFKNLSQLRQPERFGWWIQAIARREAMGLAAGKAAQLRTESQLLAELAASVEPPPPEDPALQVVRGVLAELEEGPERRVVTRFYVDGDCTVQQIADELGLAKGTITSRLTRFRARIKRRLVALVAAEDVSKKEGLR
jgi:RNA polymerase sigma-70 factor (ECF subfamily)